MPVRQITGPECVGCGLCCRNWFVEVTLDDFVDYRTPLGMTRELGPEEQQPDLGVRVMRQKSSGACVALDEDRNLCTIYENRPEVCRNFERLSRECWKKIQTEGAIRRFEVGA